MNVLLTVLERCISNKLRSKLVNEHISQKTLDSHHSDTQSSLLEIQDSVILAILQMAL